MAPTHPLPRSFNAAILVALLTLCLHEATAAEFLNVGGRGGDVTVGSIQQAASGGYILAGREGSRSWLQKIDRNLATEWERIFNQGRRGHSSSFAINAADGGYWVGGRTSESPARPDVSSVAFAAKVTANGNLLWETLLGTEFGGEAYCGIDVPRGLVVVGSKLLHYPGQPNKSGFMRTSVPWIALLGSDGKVVWEKTVDIDGGDSFESMVLEEYRGCASVLLEDGTFVLGVSVVANPTTRNETGQVIVNAAWPPASRDNFLLRLDMNGTEMNRLRLPNGQRAFMFRSGADLIFLDHVLGALDKSNPNRRFVGGAVRVTLLDDALKLKRQSSHYLAPFGGDMRVAFPLADGSMFMGGISNTGNRQVGRFRLDGALSLLPSAIIDPRQVVSSPFASFAISPGRNEDEFVMYLAERPPRFITFELRNNVPMKAIR